MTAGTPAAPAPKRSLSIGPDGWLAEGRGVLRRPSPNHDQRPDDEDPCLLVIHNISLPPGVFTGEAIIDFFQNRLDIAAHPWFEHIRDLRVSAHFLIRRDGTIVQFVPTVLRAWHAGVSSFEGRERCNDFSIGIELEGSDNQPFAPQQYQALWPLLQAICAAYPITAMAGHEHVAPGRKTDPGPHFNWQELARRFPGMELPTQVTA